MSMMLPTVPAELIVLIGRPAAPDVVVTPEKRVTNASPGRTNDSCAASGTASRQTSPIATPPLRRSIETRLAEAIAMALAKPEKVLGMRDSWLQSLAL
jgi:hypothetical protein